MLLLALPGLSPSTGGDEDGEVAKLRYQQTKIPKARRTRSSWTCDVVALIRAQQDWVRV